MISILLLFRPFPLSSYLQEADKYISLKKAVLQGTVCANLWQRSMGRLAKKECKQLAYMMGMRKRSWCILGFPATKKRLKSCGQWQCKERKPRAGRESLLDPSGRDGSTAQYRPKHKKRSEMVMVMMWGARLLKVSVIRHVLLLPTWGQPGKRCQGLPPRTRTPLSS